MKISASLYSNKQKSVEELAKELDIYQIDSFHIDCLDDLSVFKDIATIRTVSKTPIDLHIISDNPEKFYPYLEEHQVEYVTFQFEDLKEKPSIPKSIQSKLGLAIVSDTPIDVFEEYKDFDFVLMMTTTPGQSGGKFRKDNFQRIRQFRKLFPKKGIYVDGGVNNEVSFILRNLGVHSVVSGSYLVNDRYIGSALLNLKANEVESHYLIKDFMIEPKNLPIVKEEKASFQSVLQSIEDGKLGFTVISDANSNLVGISSNADVRRGLLKNLNEIQSINIDDIINRTPITINQNSTISEMLQMIKSLGFVILFLPVVDDNNRLVGAITFNNFIFSET